MLVWSYSLGSVLVVSLISLVGVLSLAISKQSLSKTISILVSLAVGTLLGDTFMHLIPESFHHVNNDKLVGLLVLGGIVLFFVLEKFVRWHHCHDLDCLQHKSHLAPMNIVGDTLHNFIDGMLIAASYMVSIPLGIATTVAVVFHEIPQELGDFGVLVYSGMKPFKAVLVNFIVALSAVLGAVVVLLVGKYVHDFSYLLLPVTAGGFIYIAGVDLIPELHHKATIRDSLGQLFFILAGIYIMFMLTQLGHAH